MLQSHLYSTSDCIVWFDYSSLPKKYHPFWEDNYAHKSANWASHNKAQFPNNTYSYYVSVARPLYRIARSLATSLPHGSGMDAKWDIVITPCDNVPVLDQSGAFLTDTNGYSVTCENDFHAMDHAGGYAGWIGGYTLTFWLDEECTPISTLYYYPSRQFDRLQYDLTFSSDLSKLQDKTDKEYGVTDEDEEFYGVDWQGIADYIEETLNYSMGEWFENPSNWAML